MKPLLAFLAWAVLLCPSVTLRAADTREPDVLYLDANPPDKLTLTLDKTARVYLDRDLSTLAAALPAGTKIQLIGLGSEGNYLLNTRYRGTRIEGWVQPGELPTIDPALIESAKKNQAWRDSVEAAIKQKRVIQGMTMDDVKRSLGKPDRTSSRQDAQVHFDTWTFITYELVPQNTTTTDPWGRIVVQTIYVKKPIGELTVEFNGGIVTGIEEHRRQKD